MYSTERKGLIWLDRSVFIEAEQGSVKTARGRISSKAQNLKKKSSSTCAEHASEEEYCSLNMTLESQPVTFSQASGFKLRRLQMWRTMPQPEDRINSENCDCWLTSVAKDPALGTSQHMDGRKVRPTKWGKSFDRWRMQMLLVWLWEKVAKPSSWCSFQMSNLLWVTSPRICLKVSIKWHWQPSYFSI